MEAAESLRPLLQHALEAVPASEHRCTPVAVKATAGLRLLGKKQSDAILKQVRTWLEAEFPFAVPGPDAVQIMDGKDEGVYAWITINYLLGLIGPAAKAGESAAVMDLGGASTQIVFEPTFPSDDLSLSPGDHVYELSLPSGKHTLYQHSHLGYGLMQARRAVHNLIAFSYVWQAAPKGVALEWEDLNAETRIPTPCLVKDGTKEVQLDPPGRKPVTVTFVGTGAGFEACRRVVDVVMAKDALCEVEPCAFGGVYQPKLMETFGKGPIYACVPALVLLLVNWTDLPRSLSYFYDRIVPLGLGVDSADFSIADLRQLTKDVCSGPEDGWSRFKGNKEAMAELEDRPEYCLDMTFLHSLLSLGYELAEERQIRTGKKLDNVELGWALVRPLLSRDVMPDVLIGRRTGSHWGCEHQVHGLTVACRVG
jgi:guanosine-diphosphatase